LCSFAFDLDGILAWIKWWFPFFFFFFFSIIDKEVSLMAEIDKVKEEASKYKTCQGTSGIVM